MDVSEIAWEANQRTRWNRLGKECGAGYPHGPCLAELVVTKWAPDALLTSKQGPGILIPGPMYHVGNEKVIEGKCFPTVCAFFPHLY